MLLLQHVFDVAAVLVAISNIYNVQLAMSLTKFELETRSTYCLFITETG